MKQILKISTVVTILSFMYSCIILPKMGDKAVNKSTIKTNNYKQIWYDFIPFIADLHCDELLWKKNLLKKIKHGHVDLPRMQKANMALQVFSIVTKSPFGVAMLAINKNKSKIGGGSNM